MTLEQQMAAALAEQFPRVRLSELEPVQQIAAGIVARIEERCAESEPGTWLQRRTIMAEEIARALEHIGRCNLDTQIRRLLKDEPRMWVEFSQAEGHWLCSIANPPDWFGGGGDSPSEALAAAMEAFDERHG